MKVFDPEKVILKIGGKEIKGIHRPAGVGIMPRDKIRKRKGNRLIITSFLLGETIELKFESKTFRDTALEKITDNFKITKIVKGDTVCFYFLSSPHDVTV